MCQNFEATFSFLAVVISATLLFIVNKKILGMKAKKNAALSSNPDYVGLVRN